MRILYGVAGEGMGHATRSRVVLEDLIREHEVRVVASGRAYHYLAERFRGVHEIWGLTLAYDDNEVRMLQTVVANLTGAASGWPQNVRAYYRLAENFMPDVVVTDFESFAGLFARRHRLPLVSVDNIHVVDRCVHDPELVRGYGAELLLGRSVVRAKLLRADHYVVTTFFFPEGLEERTTLVPPILRPEILDAAGEPGDHLLVYQTQVGAESLPPVLAACGMPCRVYGLRRDLAEDVVDGNLTYRPFSERVFIDDLRTARGVVAGGGFSLLSEAVYLRKPALSIPIGGQVEQVLNALYLDRLGYGMHATEPTAEALAAFLERIPDCERALSSYSQDGNAVALAAVREQIAAAVAR
jgi:uncharacterized protein (TIGR00661 family)